MKNTMIFLTMLILFSCKPKEGAISGNVFWKYNNFVGNKPDAGSNIILINISDTSMHLKNTCDVQGNFLFEKIPIGEYLLIVRSKNTNDSPQSHLANLLRNKIIIYDGLKINLDTTSVLNDYFFVKSKIDSAQEEVISSTTNNYYEKRRILNRWEDSLYNVSSLYLKYIEDKVPNSFGRVPFSLDNKYNYSLLKVEEGKTTQVVIDFGITYFK